MKKNDELAAAFLAGDNSSVQVEALPIGQLLMRSFFPPLELSRFLNKELERVNQRVWEDKKKQLACKKTAVCSILWDSLCRSRGSPHAPCYVKVF